MRKLVVVLILAGFVHGATKDLQIAAAANLSPVFPELLAAFRQAHPGISVGVSFGASALLVEQIRKGAPFDVLLAASPEYADYLDPAIVRSRTTFAIGRLVLYIPKHTGVALYRLDTLENSRIRKVAVANPLHAPYGKAAIAALKHAGLYERIKHKIIYAANASQAAQMTIHGADAGLIPLSSALHPALRDSGNYWLIPSELHPPLEQIAVLLNDSRPARDFFDFLASRKAREILSRHGFEEQ